MKLHEYMTLLHSLIGGDKKAVDFFIEVFDSYVDSPNSGCNPLEGLAENTLSKYLTGKSQISKKNVRTLLKAQNPHKLADYISNEATSDTLDRLEEHLTTIGKYVQDSSDDVSLVCAKVLTDILEQSLNSSPPKQDDNRMSVSDIPVTTISYREGKFIFGDITIDLPEKEDIPDLLTDYEAVYSHQLLLAYSDRDRLLPNSSYNLENLPPKYLKHLQVQRVDFFNADYVLRTIENTFSGGEELSSSLKEEVHNAVYDILFENHADGLTKLTEVLKHISAVTFTRPEVTLLPNFIGIAEKKGLCHILVNEQTIYWVELDE
ncbi:TPA: ABC-three component system protein [Streptococcus suis]